MFINNTFIKLKVIKFVFEIDNTTIKELNCVQRKRVYMKINSILKHKLLNASGWYTVTNFFVKGISFLTIPIFTRILTTEDYGIVSLYLTWVSLFSVFISLDLSWSVQRGKFEFKKDFDNSISSVLFL